MACSQLSVDASILQLHLPAYSLSALLLPFVEESDDPQAPVEVDYKKKETSRAVSARERSYQSIRVRLLETLSFATASPVHAVIPFGHAPVSPRSVWLQSHADVIAPRPRPQFLISNQGPL
jgi:hypothetical protein